MSELDLMWQHLEGHHRLTVRVVQAFPEPELFTFKPVEAMRTFAQIAGEILQIEAMTITGIATGEWNPWDNDSPLLKCSSKTELVNAFAAVRRASSALWPKITLERLAEIEPDNWTAQPTSMRSRREYMRDNEIHHRGQGYVYLRLLGIEPPAFWER